MATNFRDDAGIVRLDGTLYAPGATVGDVLTVQADGSLAPATGGGGGSPGAVRVLKHDFDFSQAAALATGVEIWTPAVNDVLLDAWFEFEGWVPDGDFLPKADIGVITDGAWADLEGFEHGFFERLANVLDLSSADPGWALDTNYSVWPDTTVGASLLQTAIIAVNGGGTRLPATRLRTTAPLSLVVSSDGHPGSSAFDGSAGSGTLYIVVSSPATTP